MIGSRRKYEVCFLLAHFFVKGIYYSKRDVETIIAKKVKGKVLVQPGFDADHLRVALCDNGFLLRDHTDQYWLNNNYKGFLEAQTPLAVLENKAVRFADIKTQCPHCEKRAYPHTLLTHFKKKHSGFYQKDMQINEYIHSGFDAAASEYLT